LSSAMFLPKCHRRAGRLENRDQRWHLPPSA